MIAVRRGPAARDAAGPARFDAAGGGPVMGRDDRPQNP